MRRIMVLLAVVFLSPAMAKMPGKEAGIRWHELPEVDVPSRSRPMLLYFGAEWCAPCKVLETQVFNQPDVHAAMGKFDAVYIDGDDDGTPPLMERFKIVVYPTLLAISPDGKDIARLVGSAQKDEVTRFLASSAATRTPRDALDRLIAGTTLDASGWATLAELEVADAAALKYRNDGGMDELKKLRDDLEQAVVALGTAQPAPPPIVATRIRIKALLLDAISDKPVGLATAHASLLELALADPAVLATEATEIITFSEEMLNYLQPDEGAAKQALAKKLLTLMESEFERQSASAPWKLEVLMLELPLLRFAGVDLDATKTRFAERIETIIKQTSGTRERLAIATHAAWLMRRTGRELRAEAILRETLAMAPDAYYIMGMLAAYAELRGDFKSVVDLNESAFRMSLRSTNGLGQGLPWLKGLVAHKSAEVDLVTAAGEELIDLAAASGNAFQGFNRLSLDSLATTLGRWVASKPGSTKKTRLREKFQGLCSGFKQDAEQAKACKNSLMLLESPPAA